MNLTVFALFVPFYDEIIFYGNPNVSASKMASARQRDTHRYQQIPFLRIHCNPKSHLLRYSPGMSLLPFFLFLLHNSLSFGKTEDSGTKEDTIQNLDGSWQLNLTELKSQFR